MSDATPQRSMGIVSSIDLAKVKAELNIDDRCVLASAILFDALAEKGGRALEQYGLIGGEVKAVVLVYMGDDAQQLADLHYHFVRDRLAPGQTMAPRPEHKPIGSAVIGLPPGTITPTADPEPDAEPQPPH